MIPAHEQELERLRKFSKDGLLSMTQVDWLFWLIDEREARVKKLEATLRLHRLPLPYTPSE